MPPTQDVPFNAVVRFAPPATGLECGGSFTPGCRNSGERNQRLGSITKAGSTMARWLLAQVTYNVLRKDPRLREWFKRIKRRWSKRRRSVRPESRPNPTCASEMNADDNVDARKVAATFGAQRRGPVGPTGDSPDSRS